jgi:hypothetical protein
MTSSKLITIASTGRRTETSEIRMMGLAAYDPVGSGTRSLAIAWS